MYMGENSWIGDNEYSPKRLNLSFNYIKNIKFHISIEIYTRLIIKKSNKVIIFKILRVIFFSENFSLI